MRKKPKEDWHNYDFKEEIKLGKREIAISLNANVLKKFMDMATDRVSRGTGLRFKFIADASRETIIKDGKEYLGYQLFSKDPYIFPNESSHTNRYDSEYNRVEFYLEKSDE